MDEKLSGVRPIVPREIPRAGRKQRGSSSKRPFVVDPEGDQRAQEGEREEPDAPRRPEQPPVAGKEAGEAGSHLDLLG